MTNDTMFDCAACGERIYECPACGAQGHDEIAPGGVCRGCSDERGANPNGPHPCPTCTGETPNPGQSCGPCQEEANTAADARPRHMARFTLPTWCPWCEDSVHVTELLMLITRVYVAIFACDHWVRVDR